MKNLVKISAVSAVILSLTALGLGSAYAGGWPVAAAVVSGVAAGAIVGTAVAASASQPAYYAYPPPVYSYTAPAYAAPAYPTPAYPAPAYAPAPGAPVAPAVAQAYPPPPALVMVGAPPVYYYPPVYPYYYPGVRVGGYWGRPYYGYRYYHHR